MLPYKKRILHVSFRERKNEKGCKGEVRTEKEEKLKDGENETIEEEKGDDRSQKQWRKRTKA